MSKKDPHERAADFEAKQEARVVEAREEAKRLLEELGDSLPAAGTGGSLETMTALPADDQTEEDTRSS